MCVHQLHVEHVFALHFSVSYVLGTVLATEDKSVYKTEKKTSASWSFYSERTDGR